jgi:hypothetical protein
MKTATETRQFEACENFKLHPFKKLSKMQLFGRDNALRYKNENKSPNKIISSLIALDPVLVSMDQLFS